MSGIYWLASYPKSGNTWLRLALASLEEGGAPVRFERDLDAWWEQSSHRVGGLASLRPIFDKCLNVESSDLTTAEIETLRARALTIWTKGLDNQVIKIHDAWLSSAGTPLLPLEATRGAVVVVRDPRDVAVSYANHCGITVDDSISAMANPEQCLASSNGKLADQLQQRLSTWSGHVAGWLDAPVPKLVVRYEEMIADMPAVLSKVAAFVGIPATPATVARAVAATRFDRLQAEEERVGFQERASKCVHFFRRGVAGGWRDSLTREQIARIEADHGAMMRRLGYAPACEVVS